MVTDSYVTIKGMSEGSYKEKGSKFLSYAFPVSNVDEVTANINALKKTHYSARHYCYAYILNDGNLSRSSDDGEPHHTAGDPILNQIRSARIRNILVVVVRYFGGTKLGKSGLINAYKSATKEALSKAEKVHKIIEKSISIQFHYEGMGDIMQTIKPHNFKILHQHYDKDCFLVCSVPVSKVAQFTKKMEALKNVIKVESLSG
jgi:uncharacterized YigZ family protein